MAGFGIGFGAHTVSRQYAALGQNVPVTVLRPSAAWDGSAGSGFGGSVPVDPVRTSAKPACRLMVPPNQFFDNELVIGVWAAANHQDSLLDDLGIDRVIAHCEGNSFEIAAPSFYMMADANGVTRRYHGWWVVLQHPGLDGNVSVYFEAIPKDPAMQRRVAGPFQFSPRAQVHDFQIEVAATPAQITGSRYKTLAAAIDYLRAQNAQNPRITMTETGTYDLNSSGAAYSGQGYCTVTATVPVTIGFASFVLGPSNNLLRPRYDGMWFKGSNITFDLRYVNYIYHDVPTGRQHVFEGINAIDSGGRGELYIGAAKPMPYMARDNPYYMECSFTALKRPAANASLVRGCTFTGGYEDVMSGAFCCVGNSISNWISAEYRNELPALSVQYLGAGATATIELTGGNGANGRVLTAKVDGASVGTFTIDATEAGYTANTNYTVQNVVDWINTLPSWTASLINNTRRAAHLGKAGAAPWGAFAATDVKSAALTLVTVIDLHAGMWQWNSAVENAIFAGNTCWMSEMACLAIGPTIGADPDVRDMMVLNNSYHLDPAAPDTAVLASQFSRSHRHVVVAHNSWANQSMVLQSHATYNPDSYCLFANNALPALTWSGAADSDLAIVGNHLFSGSAPAGATGTTTGGTMASAFANAGAGDFTPAGVLLSNQKVPLLRYDRAGVPRGIPAPIGAAMSAEEVAPAITSANPSGTYAEGVAISGRVTANKPVTWSVTGADAAAVTINAATGDWVLEATDFETKTAYAFTFVATDAALDFAEQVVAIAISDVDEIAPTLTLPVDAANGANAASLSIVTNEAGGTLFWYVSTSAVAPSVAQMLAGSGAAAAGSQAVAVAGMQSVAVNGLQSASTYFAHFLHRDGAANVSAIATGDGFTTQPAAGSGVSIVSQAMVLNTSDNVSSYTGAPFAFSGQAGRVLVAVVLMSQAATQAVTAMAATVNGVEMTRISGAARSGGSSRPILAVFAATGLSAGNKTVVANLAGGSRSCTILLLEIAGLDNANLLANTAALEGNSLTYSRSYTPGQAGNLVLSALELRQGSTVTFVPDPGVTELLDISTGTTSISDHTAFVGYAIANGTAAANVGATTTLSSECLFVVTELRAA